MWFKFSLTLAVFKVLVLGFGLLVDKNILADFINNCWEHLFYYLQSGKDSRIWAQILDLIMAFKFYLMKKIQALIGVQYQLHNNGADYFKILQTN